MRLVCAAVLALSAAQLCVAKVNCKKELARPQSLEGLRNLLSSRPKDSAWIEPRIAQREQAQKDEAQADKVRKEAARLAQEGTDRRFSIPIRHPVGQSIVFVGGKNITVVIKDRGDFGSFGAPNYVAVNLGEKDSVLGFAIIANRLVHVWGNGKVIVDGKDSVLLTEDGWEAIGGSTK